MILHIENGQHLSEGSIRIRALAAHIEAIKHCSGGQWAEDRAKILLSFGPVTRARKRPYKKRDVVLHPSGRVRQPRNAPALSPADGGSLTISESIQEQCEAAVAEFNAAGHILKVEAIEALRDQLLQEH